MSEILIWLPMYGIGIAVGLIIGGVYMFFKHKKKETQKIQEEVDKL